MISNELLIKGSGQYDKEIIQRLRLDRKGISKISNLESCISLIELNLSGNEITSISGLDNLLALKRLDLSFNKIRRIENIENLSSLEHLDLRGNLITDINSLSILSNLPNFKSLTLKGTEGEDSNPVCSNSKYTSILMNLLPNLEVLDGGHLDIARSFENMEFELQKLQPDPSTCHTPPNEPWFTQKDLNIGINNDSNFDVDSYLKDSKLHSTLIDSHKKIVDILNEDCAHMLRKAQTSISKAFKL